MTNSFLKREMQGIKEEVADEDFENEIKEFNNKTSKLNENENKIKCIKQEKDEKPRKNLATKLFICELCEKGFNKKFNLEVHMRVHTGDKPFVCEICKRAFTTNNSLNNHMVTHSKDKQYVCGICGKSYSRKNTLKCHLEAHSIEFPCVVCSGHFSTRNELQKMHSRLNLKQSGVEVPGAITQERCSKCDKSFTNVRNLDQDTKSFHSEKNSSSFSCAICNKTYNVKSSLKFHMRMHTGENLYKCDLCSYAWPSKSGFDRHRRTHTGEKPFECNECEFKAVSKYHLKRHITCSFTEKFNNCNICDVKFRYKCAYKAHNKIHDS